MRASTTLIGQGVAGNNISANTLVALINAPGPGRYKIWGHCRHTLADGLKLTSPIAIVFSGGPNDTVNFGPFILDINNTTAGINVNLNVATGAADTASAVIYAERLGAP